MSRPLQTGFRMFLLILLSGFASLCRAQISGTKTVPGDYATITAAVGALNTQGIGSGGVTINVAAGFTETIGSTISLTATGTVANPITIQKNPAIPGPNPLITAYKGGTATPASAVQDGIFRLLGSDHVTIAGIDLRENPSNTTNPSTMEYGFALYKASTSNGCQFVTIRDCVVTLSLLNNTAGTAPMADGSCGIIMTNATANAAVTNLTPIAGGAHSNNTFRNNTIQNTNTGIALMGYLSAAPYTLSDANNTIGGTAGNGNSILNFGGAAGAASPAVGIRTQGQYGLLISNNTLNSNTGTGGSHPFTLRGILLGAAPEANATASSNQITLSCAGSTQNSIGIDNATGSSGILNTVSISGNTVSGSTYTTATTGGFYGILNSASPFQLDIQSNTISGNSSAATGTGFVHGIFNSGIATRVNIRSNTINGNSAAAINTGLYTAINNTAACQNLSIAQNTVFGNTSSATAGNFSAVNNSGAVTNSIAIDSNNLGNPTTPYVTFSNANTVTQTCIVNTAGGAAGSLSISGNNFYNIGFTTASSGAVVMLSNSAAVLGQTISNNIFNNLNPNTSGNLTLMSNSGALGATGTQYVRGNSINGTLGKAAGGTVTLFTSSGNSASGAVAVHSGNTFSNINVTGATTISGWVNTDGGAGGRVIQNNTFSNWTGGTGTITAMNVNQTGASNLTTGNTINGISCSCAITGITTAAGNDNIVANRIYNLTTNGASNITGIAVTSGTQKHIQRNKIYDLQASVPGGTVFGISLTGSTSAVVNANIYNNLIGNLYTPASSSTDAIRGINLNSSRANSNLNVCYNTIYLNAGSTGTNFGSSGIYHAVSATATTASLTLRNNIVTNFSTPNGTGLTVAYRRSGASFANYNTSSNNNLFFGGPASTNRLIFANGSTDQNIAGFKTRVAPMDAQSVTEDLSANFLSTAGANINFLHLDPAIPTQAESGAGVIANVNIDVDSQARAGNPNYAGTGSAPDMGADEFNGIRALPLSGTYTVGTGGNYPSLTQNGGLFADVNSLGLAGDVTISIISNLSENGANPLTAWEEQGVGNYRLTIVPGNAGTKLITGSVAGPLIRLQGAKRVEIDGRFNNAGRNLIFRNTSTAGASGTALSFINGASDNLIQHAQLEAVTGAAFGVVHFASSTVAGGNSNNTVSNCQINATVAGSTGTMGVYSVGSSTAGFENTGNTLSDNLISSFRDRGIETSVNGNLGWTITGNHIYNGDVSGPIVYLAGSTVYGIRVGGGNGHEISKNIIGGSAANAGGAQASYTSTAGLLTYGGIYVNATTANPVTTITGNTVANIAVSAAPTSTSPNGTNVFLGIETIGNGIVIGGTLAGEANTIGSTTANNSISILTTTATTNRSNIRGISCGSTGGSITANKIGGFDIRNTGAAPGPSTFAGIHLSNAAPPTQVAWNTVGSTTQAGSIRVLSASTAVGTTLYGINIASTVIGATQLDGNTVQNLAQLSTSNTTGTIAGINSAASGAATLSITNNTISSNSVSTHSGTIFGILNTGTAGNLAISNNVISNFSSGSTAGLFTAIANTGAVTGAIAMNANQIGTATLPSINFSAANSSASIFINNSGGGAAANLSISNNVFNGVNYATAGTGSCTFIQNTAATISQAINGNTFVNMNVNTAGNINFIANSIALAATGTQNINSNSIVTGFTKRAGGTITFSNSSANSASGSITNQNSNNFSNLNLSGATSVAGWINTDAGSGTKNIQNNIFSNWTGSSTGSFTALNVNLSNATNAVSGNLIQNLTGAGTITGIATGTGADNIFGNTVSGLISSGNVTVTGINITGGSGKRTYRNKIYDLQAGGATGNAYGIGISGSTATLLTIYNNLIGDLRVPAANTTVDVVRGISITSTAANAVYNLYFNTIHLTATSSGANFASSGVYQTVSLTATTAALNMINNIVSNNCMPKGLGLTVAYRRSGIAGANYSATSNNNLLFAGTPGSMRLLFADGLVSDQHMWSYKLRVAPRDSASVTEDLSTTFLSTTGSSSVFLHLNSQVASLTESGGINIPGITDDFDAQIRHGNAGYSGGGYAPDIGADEVYGIEAIPPAISYTALGNTTSTANRVLGNVTITDASGVNTTPGSKPRLYYKRFHDANTFADNTPATNGWKYVEAGNAASPFSFTTDYSLLFGGAIAVGEIQYFVVAQDLATIANTGINSGTFNAMPAGVALTPAAFPIGGTINSFNIPFSGTYTVGNAEVFTSLTRAEGIFASINRVGLSGNTTIVINTDLSEDGYSALNQWTETGAGNYILRIVPDAPTLRIASGDAPNGLIRFNGADRVRIDGSNAGGGQYLQFRNTNNSAPGRSALSFDNGSTADSVRNCLLDCAGAIDNGVVVFGNSGTAGGNSNNVVDYCTINATVGGTSGPIAILSKGNAGAGFENVNNVISNSNITGFTERGIDLGTAGASGWTIANNSLYNAAATASINFPASTTLFGIRIGSGSGYTISGNSIGGSLPLALGSSASYNSNLGPLSYEGISLTTGASTPASSITGNRIARLALSCVPNTAGNILFTGIRSNGQNITIGAGNSIGSNTTNGSITINTSTTSSSYQSVVRGIHVQSGGTVQGNQVASTDIVNSGSAPAPSWYFGIQVDATSQPVSIVRNIVGSTGVGAAGNSIRIRNTSTAADNEIYGIYLDSAVTGTILIDSNTLQNFTNSATGNAGQLCALQAYAPRSSSVVIRANSIRNILAAGNASAGTFRQTGIRVGTPAILSWNLVDNMALNATGTGSRLRGIHATGSGALSIQNNELSNLTTASTRAADVLAAAAANHTLCGILVQGSQVAIRGNKIHHLAATANGAVQTAISAIGTEGGSGEISENRIAYLTTSAAQTPGLAGIHSESSNLQVYNNVVNIDNGIASNPAQLYGIAQLGTGSNGYYFNTVQIAGGTSSGTARAAAFIRTATASVVLKNNVLINIRTGSGARPAISNLGNPAAQNWGGGVSDYNNMYSAAAGVGEWGAGNLLSFAGWKSASSGGAQSMNRAVSFLSSVYDLEPNGASNCALDNSGIAVSSPVSITADINGITRGTPPDMGAYEFGYVPFVVDASSDAPVCNGSALSLSVDAGTAISPTFNWRNPSFTNFSTAQNPSATGQAGFYKVIVTDANGCVAEDSTQVTLFPRPTLRITGPTTVCNGSTISVTLTMTGTGTITGSLNSGDNFSALAPGTSINLTPAVSTNYFVSSLSDQNCVATFPADAPDTLSVIVRQAGLWSGNISTDWNLAGNWLCGAIPAAGADITIPGSRPFYPRIRNVSPHIGDLLIQNGGRLTVDTGTLYIAGAMTRTGTGVVYDTSAAGVIVLDGTMEQNLPGSMFFQQTARNLTIDNSDGVSIGDTLKIGGVLLVSQDTLKTNGRLKLLSNATQTALIDGSGGGEVMGQVTMYRYLANGRGYHYVSSPFKAATVAELADDIDLNAAFATIYRNDESLQTNGWVKYNAPTNVLLPLTGYAINCGNPTATKTIDIRGVVNNGTLNTGTLYNHNNTYTKGFNLLGNPYPSPVDWNAGSGWTRSNIDNAVYYFNPGGADQYTGSYASYINGISSDGIASNIIPALQGFFVHVSNGSFPVSGSLSINNAARTNALNPVYHRGSAANPPLVRLRMSYAVDTVHSDHMTVYLDDESRHAFEPATDALKLLNTDELVPNLYAMSGDGQQLSISAVPTNSDSTIAIPLGVKNSRDTAFRISLAAMQELPAGMRPWIADATNGRVYPLDQQSFVSGPRNGDESGLYLLLSRAVQPTIPGSQSSLTVIPTATGFKVRLTEESGSLRVLNAAGQCIQRDQLNGVGYHEIPFSAASGVYIVQLEQKGRSLSGKVLR